MLYREIIAVCSEIHAKHINTLCGQNVEFVNVKPGGKDKVKVNLIDAVKAYRGGGGIAPVFLNLAFYGGEGST
jgi:hypothetical protein